MDKTQLTPEELAAEQAAIAEVKEEEVRGEVVEAYGFDPDVDADKIAVAVEREMAHRKKLSGAIGQKIKYRTDIEEFLKKNPPKTPPAPAADAATVTAEVTKALENRDLEDLDLPDEIKNEVKKLAALQGSVKKAKSDPYIIHLIEQHKASQKEDDAAIQRKGKGGKAGKTTFDPNTPPDVDMKTLEGQKAWEDWKAEARKQGF